MIILIRGMNISQAFAWLILLPGCDSLIAILSISPSVEPSGFKYRTTFDHLGFLSGFTDRYLQADACIDRTRFSNNSTASWLLGRSTGTGLDWFGEIYGFLVFRGAEGLPKVIPRWISLKSLLTAVRWTRSRRTLLTVIYVTVSRFTTFLIYKWDGYAHLLKKPGFPPIPRDGYFECPTFWIYDRHLIVRREGRPPNAQFWPDIYISSMYCFHMDSLKFVFSTSVNGYNLFMKAWPLPCPTRALCICFQRHALPSSTWNMATWSMISL